MAQYIEWKYIFEANADGSEDWLDKVHVQAVRDSLTPPLPSNATIKRRIAVGQTAYRVDPPTPNARLATETIRVEAGRRGIKYVSQLTADEFLQARRQLMLWIKQDQKPPERWRRLFANASRSLKEELGEPSSATSTEERSDLRRLLLRWPPEGVSLADPHDLGVFRSATAKQAYPDTSPPYVPRQIDEDLMSALKRLPLLIVVGPAKAGKSRTAFEAIARAIPTATILVPRAPAALRDILDAIEATPFGGPVVLWLDEMGNYTTELTIAEVQRWSQLTTPVVGIGTITGREQKELETTKSPWSRLLFDHVRHNGGEFWLDSELSGDEVVVAQKLYPQSPKHLGEHLAAIDILKRKLERGKEDSPEGVALVRAAIALRRSTYVNNMHMSVLVRVWWQYMRRFAPRLPLTDPVFLSALRWAQEPVASSAALLTYTSMRNVPAFELVYGRAREAAEQGFEAMYDSFHRHESEIPYSLNYLDFARVARAMGMDKDFSEATPAELRTLLDKLYEVKARTIIFDVPDAIIEHIDAQSDFVSEMEEMVAYLPHKHQQAIDTKYEGQEPPSPWGRSQMIMIVMLAKRLDQAEREDGDGKVLDWRIQL
jgi:hypothetical protein